MSAALLPEDSAAADSCRELLADFPQFREVPGLPQARMLVAYIICRRRCVLDVSGSDAAELSTLAELSTGDGATAGETWAIINAPKTTSALAETVAGLQPYVSAIIVIGRSAAMSRAVNKELALGFGRVDVSPGVGQHRMIIATRPLSAPSLSVFPKHGTIAHPGVGELEVRAHGACFSGVRSDEGSTLLLDAVIEASPAAESVFDLGCGNGWLLTAVTRVTGAPRAVGVDVSKAAVASARATVEANGIDADIVTGDAADPDDPGVAQL